MTGAWDVTPTEGPITSVSTELTIGVESKNPDYHRFFVGAIDDVRIWRAARSQALIQQDMTRRLTGGESNLVAYWDFEEGSGNTVADLAGGHDGLGLSPRWVPRAECTGEPADFKADGFVDAYDYPFLAESLAGPDVSTPPLGCTQDHFDLADLQGDNDVDRRDFAMFIEAVTP